MNPSAQNSSTARNSTEQKPQPALPSTSQFTTPSAPHLNVGSCQRVAQQFDRSNNPNTYQHSIVHQGVAIGQHHSHIHHIPQPGPSSSSSTSNLRPNQSSSRSTNPASYPSIPPSAPADPQLHFGIPISLNPHRIFIQSPQVPSTHPTPMFPSINSISPIMPPTSIYPWNVYPSTSTVHHPFRQENYFVPSNMRRQSVTSSEQAEISVLDECSVADSENDIPLLDLDTPSPVTEMVLDAIGVRPYEHLEKETRTPELFIEQFETFADLLEMNDTQKRVMFAKLAYRDEAARFEAIKFDTNYHIMKANFPNVIRCLQIHDRNRRNIEAAHRRSSIMRRIRSFFCKWCK